MILIESKLLPLVLCFLCQKGELKQVVYHKKVFPSDKKEFLKEEIGNIYHRTYYRTYLNFEGIVKAPFMKLLLTYNAGQCIHYSFLSLLYFWKQKAQ